MSSRVFTFAALAWCIAAAAGCVRTAECDELVLCPATDDGDAQVCLDFVCTPACTSDDACTDAQVCTACATLEQCSSDANLALSACVAPLAGQ